MIIYKCKMCGGNLKVQEGSKITTCEYCQTQQTVPTTDDEKRANLFNRANHFRQNSEFDKAMGIYEHIVEEDGCDAEAYWSIVLCKYGIEYVEDPVSKIQKPTVNRTQTQSILQDTDYQMALEHADQTQRELYEKEAKEIDHIQKEILLIAQNESPYDVFICYKESTPNGTRTKSSVLAQDVYNHLTKEGYRVFFSRVSLEDKLGQKYEPYIYSALTSARIMLVIGTEKDEFAAPWVRNEWGRFLVMMRENPSKLLIPCYRGIDIDDLPNEFQILQSQDMSKIGFEQDLLHGISKVINAKGYESKKIEQGTDTAKSLERLYQNAETYMRLQNYQSAAETYKNITQLYPEDYRGWWGLIQSNTRNLTTKDIKNIESNTLNKWFGYVKTLASGEIYKEKLDQYISFWEDISESQAIEEIARVERIIKNHRSEIDKLNSQISNVSAEENRRRQEFREQDETLKSRIDESKKECSYLYEEANRIFINKVIAWGILIVSVVVGFILTGANEIILGPGLFWCGTIVGIFLIKRAGKMGKVSDKEGKAEQIKINSIPQYDKKRIANKNNFDREIGTLNEKKTLYYDSMEQYKQKISECNMYLEYGQDEIAKLLFVYDCWAIGARKEPNREIHDLRNRALASPDKAVEEVLKGDIS